MLRRSFIRFALVVIALFALTTPALAGGVSVTLDSPPADLQAGVAFTIGFTIRSAHEDRALQPGLTPVIKAASVSTDEQVIATGTAEGPVGHYVATLTLPSVGTWQWQIQPFGDSNYTLSLPGPLEVRARGAKAVPVAKSSPSKTLDAKAVDDSFTPSSITMEAGTTVKWNMGGVHPHTVTAADGIFASGNLEPGTTYSFTFTKPGTYKYYCEYHGNKDGQGMAGTITVIAAPVSAQAPKALPITGTTDRSPVAALAVALLAAALGVVLRHRNGRSLR